MASGELEQITSDAVLRAALATLEDGFRLTLWAYEKNEVRISDSLCVLEVERHFCVLGLLSLESVY